MDLMGSKHDNAVSIEMTWDDLVEVSRMFDEWKDTAWEMYRDPSPHMTKEDRESNKRYWEYWTEQAGKVRVFVAKEGEL
jgi:hypothetical protein